LLLVFVFKLEILKARGNGVVTTIESVCFSLFFEKINLNFRLKISANSTIAELKKQVSQQSEFYQNRKKNSK
jgi:hypothetical protein